MRTRVLDVRALGAEGCERLESRLALAAGAAANPALPAYDVGMPALADIWVDPTAGDDARGGGSRAEAVRTLTEAWRRVPVGVPLAHGVRINLVAGTYSAAAVPNYWENRVGTQAAPIIVRAADGAGTARLPGVNVYGCRFLYFDGLEISAGGGDVLHFEACSQILVRNTTVRGTGTIATYAVPQEALKANQCQYVYIENCDISGAWDNAIDFVAVQYGHVVGSRIHRAGDWAMYAKGGSASLTIAGNEFFDAGTGGFTAGQGTGFEFMTAPWLRYEAHDITFTDNVIHDTQGAGIGVNGGTNIVMANNTMYRVGSRSHVIEVGFGLRSCDGDRAKCTAYLAQGGWGTNVPGREEPIPNHHVVIRDNIVLNPDGYRSQWQHFAVATSRTPSAGSNIPAPARADDGLQIYGNVIWNGAVGHALGIEQPVLSADVSARNAINTARPVLVDPARGDYRVVTGDAPTPPPGAPPTPAPAPAPTSPLVARIRAVAVGAGRSLTTFVVTFNRAVTGVTIDDFGLLRGRTTLVLNQGRITTTDNRTFTISNVRGTNLAGSYTLRLKPAGTGIADAWSIVPASGAAFSWRMTRSVRA
ncbi:MAG: right-handed parallel beta-helix repeat-containing protein [Planctomycetia bacterium]|nr:right-handed parallel beta-helix repeat-containing protein [Planctomycetia bacterium]